MKFQIPHFELDLSRLGNFPQSPPEPEFKELDKKFRTRFAMAGFYDWPVVIQQNEIDALKKTADDLRKKNSGALLIGIGGSYLGAATLIDALSSHDNEDFPIQWISNVDPHAIQKAEDFLKKHPSAAATVISKSGNTMETLAAFFHYCQRFDTDQIVVVTDPMRGELRRLAEAHHWTSFEVPPNIGGRYSVLTPVGLLPAAMAGIDITAVIEGAKEVRDYLESCGPEENPALVLAWHLHAWDKRFQRNIHYCMPYMSNLKRLSDWYVQLWAESLGKRNPKDPKRGVGPTPVASLGSSDQHSVLQLIKEGPADKVVGFLGSLNTPSPEVQAPPFKTEIGHLAGNTFQDIITEARRATEQSLENSAIPCYRLEFEKLTEKTVGGILFFYQAACAYAAECYGIDAFDQPGVEESKILLGGALKEKMTSGER